MAKIRVAVAEYSEEIEIGTSKCAQWGYKDGECWRTTIETTALDAVKRETIEDIKAYDSSDKVNSFTVNGVETWLSPSVRSNYRTSIDAAELLGEGNITLQVAGLIITVTIQQAKEMLAQIQRYADNCFIVTGKHKKNVNDCTSIKEIEEIDITSGYPEKIKIEL